jgi:hypothetical protein
MHPLPHPFDKVRLGASIFHAFLHATQPKRAH